MTANLNASLNSQQKGAESNLIQPRNSKRNSTMKTQLITLFLITVSLVAGAQTTSVEQLQTTVNQMQKTITNLQQQVIDLKAAQATGSAMAIVPTTNGVVVFVPAGITNPQASQITWREVYRDYQEAAPRPNNTILDPQYKGFIPIP